jgi:hypothetical protein
VYQIAIESLKRAAKVDMTFIPYPGGAPALNALLGEHVTSLFLSYSTMAEQLKAGKLRALATWSRTRIESLPEVPTVAESGYKDYEMDEWNGVLAPARTPKNAVSQLADRFTAALQAPEVKRKLVAQGVYPVGMCGADFAALLRKQYDEYGRIIREATSRRNKPRRHRLRGKCDETFSSSISASDRGRRRAAGPGARRRGADLSDAHGAHHRRRGCRRPNRHDCAPHGAMVVRATRPNFPRRESSGRW